MGGQVKGGNVTRGAAGGQLYEGPAGRARATRREEQNRRAKYRDQFNYFFLPFAFFLPFVFFLPVVLLFRLALLAGRPEHDLDHAGAVVDRVHGVGRFGLHRADDSHDGHLRAHVAWDTLGSARGARTHGMRGRPREGAART